MVFGGGQRREVNSLSTDLDVRQSSALQQVLLVVNNGPFRWMSYAACASQVVDADE